MADLVNMMMYLQYGKKFPDKLKIKGEVNTKSLIGYKKYTERDKSRSDDKERFAFNGGYMEYTSRANSRSQERVEIKSYTNYGWIKTDDEKKKFREELEQYFNKEGDIAWVPVSSFKDYMTAKQYGLFKEDDYAAVVSAALPKFFKSVGLDPNNMIWWIDYHDNKAHPHTHLVFLEKNKTRTNPKFTLKQINNFKGMIFDEMNKRSKIIEGIQDQDIIKFKDKDKLYKSLQDKANDLIQKRENDAIDKNIKTLLSKLPGKTDKHKRLQYNSSHMIPYRRELDDIVERILTNEQVKPIYDDFLKKTLELEKFKSEKLNTEYTNIRDAEDKKIRVYLANQILKLKKLDSSVININLVEKTTNKKIDKQHTLKSRKLNISGISKNHLVSEYKKNSVQYSGALINHAIKKLGGAIDNVDQETERAIEAYYNSHDYY